MTLTLLISPTGVLGGAERALINLAKHLPRYGTDLRAVLLADGPLRQELEAVGCPTKVIPTGRTRQLPETRRTIEKLAALAEGADVVISNQSKGHIFGGLAARKAKVPEIWWQHSIPGTGRIDRIAARVPSAAVVCTTAAADSAQRRLSPRARIVQIPPGTEVDAVSEFAGSGVEVRHRLGWNEQRIVGIVGRLEPWKGQSDFLRAAALLATTYKDLRFVVVGGAILGSEGDYPEKLESLARDLELEGLVHFAGQQDDVYPWFDALDVVVSASQAEPFGLVVVEALALGKPVVAYADGGPLEITEDGKSGVLVPPGDWVALEDGVRRVLNDSTLAKQLGDEGRARANLFTSQRSASEFAELAHSVVSRSTTWKPSKPSDLTERTVPGLHSHVLETVLTPFVRSGMRCVDLGAGSGALAQRLEQLGGEVIAVDIDPEQFKADCEFRRVDLNDPGFAASLGSGVVDVVTAVEVIEHLESPISFLRSLAELLSPNGVAVITTPNVDSLPARVKFLLKGKIRMLDEHGDPTHISPIFWDLLIRQYLPLAGLELRAHSVFPPRGFVTGRPAYRRAMKVASLGLRGRQNLVGDNHVLVLERPRER